jgi:exodeoxyribonuclease VII small subunit
MATSKPALTYETALKELEDLIARLEGGQLPLDDMLSAYQRGSELLAFCQSKLQVVQNQIQVLQSQDTTTGAAK